MGEQNRFCEGSICEVQAAVETHSSAIGELSCQPWPVAGLALGPTVLAYTLLSPGGVLCRAASSDQDSHGRHGASAGGRPPLRRRGHAQAGEALHKQGLGLLSEGMVFCFGASSFCIRA